MGENYKTVKYLDTFKETGTLSDPRIKSLSISIGLITSFNVAVIVSCRISKAVI